MAESSPKIDDADTVVLNNLNRLSMESLKSLLGGTGSEGKSKEELSKAVLGHMIGISVDEMILVPGPNQPLPLCDQDLIRTLTREVLGQTLTNVDASLYPAQQKAANAFKEGPKGALERLSEATRNKLGEALALSQNMWDVSSQLRQIVVNGAEAALFGITEQQLKEILVELRPESGAPGDAPGLVEAVLEGLLPPTEQEMAMFRQMDEDDAHNERADRGRTRGKKEAANENRQRWGKLRVGMPPILPIELYSWYNKPEIVQFIKENDIPVPPNAGGMKRAECVVKFLDGEKSELNAGRGRPKRGAAAEFDGVAAKRSRGNVQATETVIVE